MTDLLSEVLDKEFLIVSRRFGRVTWRRGTVARVIKVAASLPHFWISLSTLMMRFTRNRGSCVVGSLVPEVFLPAEGGGVGLMVGGGIKVGRSPHRRKHYHPS